MSICDEAMSKATNKGYLITAEGCTPVDIPKEDGLQTMYKLIGCSMARALIGSYRMEKQSVFILMKKDCSVAVSSSVVYYMVQIHLL